MSVRMLSFPFFTAVIIWSIDTSDRGIQLEHRFGFDLLHVGPIIGLGDQPLNHNPEDNEIVERVYTMG